MLLHDKKVKSLKCPVCGAKLEKSLPLFSLNNKHYFTMGICKYHGAVKSKIRIKKEELQGLPYAVKTTRLIDHDEKESLKQKYQKSISSKSE